MYSLIANAEAAPAARRMPETVRAYSGELAYRDPPEEMADSVVMFKNWIGGTVGSRYERDEWAPPSP
jgi:hypothetical protein